MDLPLPSPPDGAERQEHGILTTYVRGCRCGACREANSDYQFVRRRDRRALVLAGKVQITHGTVSAYTNWWCRCAECTRAATAATTAGRARRAAKAAES